MEGIYKHFSFSELMNYNFLLLYLSSCYFSLKPADKNRKIQMKEEILFFILIELPKHCNIFGLKNVKISPKKINFPKYIFKCLQMCTCCFIYFIYACTLKSQLNAKCDIHFVLNF